MTKNQINFYPNMMVSIKVPKLHRRRIVNRPVYPAKYFLSLFSEDFTKWKERWEKMIWSIKPKYNHIKFSNFMDAHIEDRGKFFKISDGSNICLADQHDIDESNIWMLPGTVTASRDSMEDILTTVKSFLDKTETKYAFSKHTLKPLILCPYIPNLKRYREAMRYGQRKESFASSSMNRFVKEYLLPRLMQNKEITIVTHSVGGREVYMIENALRRILSEDYNLSALEISGYFSKVKAVLYGHAQDIECLPFPRFKKAIVLSASDQGVLIPMSLYRAIYKKLYSSKHYSCFNMNNFETIMFLGHKASVEVIDGKINRDGHRLAHYIASTLKLPEQTLGLIEDYIICSPRKDACNESKLSYFSKIAA